MPEVLKSAAFHVPLLALPIGGACGFCLAVEHGMSIRDALDIPVIAWALYHGATMAWRDRLYASARRQ